MVSTEQGFSSFHFSTRNLAANQRVAKWNNEFGRAKARRMLAPTREGDGSFHLEMSGYTLGHRNPGQGRGQDHVEVMRVAVTTGGAAQRTRELMADGNDDLVLHIQQSGSRIASQLGREQTVAPGAGILTTNAEPSTILLPGAARFVCIAVPRVALLDLAPGFENALVRSLPSDAEILRLLVRYLDILQDDATLGTPALRHAITMHLHDLCALAVGAAHDAADIARSRGLRAARLQAIKAHIARNLADATLSAEAIARREGISTRYLHKLFEGEGTTLSRYVLGLRLRRVHRMLGDGRHAGKKIAALAFDAGFSDVSTFNREFRRRYAATPSDIRAASVVGRQL
jgi:AraC-like DNA-binding protein